MNLSTFPEIWLLTLVPQLLFIHFNVHYQIGFPFCKTVHLSFCYRETETPFICPILYFFNSILHTHLHIPHIVPPFPQWPVICKDLPIPMFIYVYMPLIIKLNRPGLQTLPWSVPFSTGYIWENAEPTLTCSSFKQEIHDRNSCAHHRPLGPCLNMI